MDYEPEIENTGVENSRFSRTIQFGGRYNMSSFVIAMMINLTLKSIGITDKNEFVSTSGVQKMRKREGKKALEKHRNSAKGNSGC